MESFEKLKKELINLGYDIVPTKKSNIVKVRHNSFAHTLAFIGYTSIPHKSVMKSFGKNPRVIVILQSEKVQDQLIFDQFLAFWRKTNPFELSISCSKYPDYINTMVEYRLLSLPYASRVPPLDEQPPKLDENGFPEEPDWLKNW